MQFPEGKGIRAPQWFPNEQLVDGDVNFLNEKEYTNLIVSLMNTLSLKDASPNIAVNGLRLTHSTLLTMSLGMGICLSVSGYYMQDGVWAFVGSPGDVFVVNVPVDTNIAVTTGDGSNDRIDIVEVRPNRTEYDSLSRAYKDPVTGLVTTAPTDTKVEYGFDFQVLAGTPSATPVAPASTAGWIKVAEVYVAQSATAITQDNIKDVRDSDSWDVDSGSLVFFDPSLGVDVDNVKRPGLGSVIIPHFIGGRYTNIVTDPTDLTTANWDAVTDGVVVTQETLNGEVWNKVAISGFSYRGVISEDIVSDVQFYTVRGRAKRGTSPNTQLQIFNSDQSHKFGVIVDWVAHTVTDYFTTEFKYTWLDDDTLDLEIRVDIGAYIGNTIHAYVFANWVGTDAVYTYWQDIQITPGWAYYPFVNGIHGPEAVSADHLFLDEFTIDTEYYPRFQYDTIVDQFIAGWDVGSTHLILKYDFATDKFILSWYDGTAIRELISQQFDNGSTYTVLNQTLRFIASLDLGSGGINDSTFIVIPSESGSVNEDTAWSGTPDTHSNFTDLLRFGGSDPEAWIANGIITATPIKRTGYGAGAFVMITSTSIWASIDGVNWTDEHTLGGGTLRGRYFAYNGTILVVCGDSNAFTSTDGFTWVDQGSVHNYWHTLMASPSYFVMTGTSNVMYTSPTGVTWTANATWAGYVLTGSSSLYAESLYIVGESTGHIYTTADPTGAWTDQGDKFAGAAAISLSYGNGIYVAGLSTGEIYTATDPTGTWTSRGIVIPGAVRSIAFGNGVFMAGDDAFHVSYSYNGIDWFDAGVIGADDMYVAYGNNRFIAGDLDFYAYHLPYYLGMNGDLNFFDIYSGLLTESITTNLEADIYFNKQSKIFEALPDAFIPRAIASGTPISLAIQKATDDMRTGQGIQDKAILERHLGFDPSIMSVPVTISEAVTKGDPIGYFEKNDEYKKCKLNMLIAEQLYDTGTLVQFVVTPMETNFFMVSWCNIGVTDFYARVGELVDGDIVWKTSETILQTESAYYHNTCYLGNEYVVIAYNDTGGSNDGEVIVVKYNSGGGTITIEGALLNFEVNGTNSIAVCNMTNDDFVVVYKDGTDSDVKCVGFNFNGSSISIIASKQTLITGTATKIDCIEINDKWFAFAYTTASTVGYGMVYFTGTSFTPWTRNTLVLPGWTGVNEVRLRHMGDGYLVIFAREDYQCRIALLKHEALDGTTASPKTLQVLFSDVSFSGIYYSTSSTDASLIVLGGGYVVFTYQSKTSSSGSVLQMRAMLAKISPSGVVFLTDEIDVSALAASIVGEGKFAMVAPGICLGFYRYNDGSADVHYRTFEVPKYLGLAKETAGSGDTVDVVHGGILEGLVGLNIGHEYRADFTDASLVESFKGIAVGKAVTTTALVVK